MAGLPAIVGFLLTVLFTALWACGMAGLLRRWLSDLDPAEQWGVAGLLGLGVVGTLTLFLGLLPNGPEVAMGALFLAGIGLAGSSKCWKEVKVSRLSGISAVGAAVFGLGGIIALIGALAPANSMEWDSLAYHLAVPKIWLEQRQIGYVEGIHHSNFPFVVDNLYLLGLQWGEAGAKAFSFCFYSLGGVWLFGYLRRTVTAEAAGWGLVLLAGIPVVLWEAGTAYIDLAHGLFAVVAAAYAAEMLGGADRRLLIGLGAGFCLGSKFTGLQVAAALSVVWVLMAPRQMGFLPAVKKFGLAALVGVLLAAPWFIKTTVLTGNPVYPYFYSKFGGRDWSEFQSRIYTNEQQSFGVPRQGGTNLGHAVLGLGYQPGRYVNPDQTNGGGFPTGSIGFAVLALALCAAAAGRLRVADRFVLAYAGLGFLMWFFLSQQSRYLTFLALPLIIPAAGLAAHAGWKRLLAGAASLQAAYSIGMMYFTQTTDQVRVALGAESREEYRLRTVPFEKVARYLNETVPSDGKIALYDEVFGYLLDPPYMWANPGHSSLIPYGQMLEGDAFADELEKLGFTHVFVNVGAAQQDAPAWIGEMGLAENDKLTPEKRAAWASNQELSWRLGLAAAVRRGRLAPVKIFGSAVVFEIQN